MNPSEASEVITDELIHLKDLNELLTSLGMIGSPSDDDLMHLDETKEAIKESQMKIKEAIPHLLDYEMPEETKDLLKELLTSSCIQGDDNIDLIDTILTHWRVDCSDVIESEALLSLSCADGNPLVLDRLLKYPNITVDEIDVVQLACYNSLRRVPLMKVLLSYPQIVDLTKPDVISALKQPIQEMFVDVCQICNEKEDQKDRLLVLDKLLNHPHIKIDLEELDVNNQTIFMRAVMQGEIEIMDLVYPKSPVELNAVLPDGSTLLLRATFMGQPKSVLWLLQHPEVEVDKATPNGTAIDLAKMKGNKQILDLLLCEDRQSLINSKPSASTNATNQKKSTDEEEEKKKEGLEISLLTLPNGSTIPDCICTPASPLELPLVSSSPRLNEKSPRLSPVPPHGRPEGIPFRQNNFGTPVPDCPPSPQSSKEPKERAPHSRKNNPLKPRPPPKQREIALPPPDDEEDVHHGKPKAKPKMSPKISPPAGDDDDLHIPKSKSKAKMSPMTLMDPMDEDEEDNTTKKASKMPAIPEADMECVDTEGVNSKLPKMSKPPLRARRPSAGSAPAPKLFSSLPRMHTHEMAKPPAPAPMELEGDVDDDGDLHNPMARAPHRHPSVGTTNGRGLSSREASFNDVDINWNGIKEVTVKELLEPSDNVYYVPDSLSIIEVFLSLTAQGYSSCPALGRTGGVRAVVDALDLMKFIATSLRKEAAKYNVQQGLAPNEITVSEIRQVCMTHPFLEEWQQPLKVILPLGEDQRVIGPGKVNQDTPLVNVLKQYYMKNYFNQVIICKEDIGKRGKPIYAIQHYLSLSSCFRLIYRKMPDNHPIALAPLSLFNLHKNGVTTVPCHVLTCSALLQLYDSKVGCIAVTDMDGKIMSSLSAADFMKITPSDMNRLAQTLEIYLRELRLSSSVNDSVTPTRSFSHRNFACCGADCPLKDAMKILLDTNCTYLVITHEERPISIISRFDILNVILSKCD